MQGKQHSLEGLDFGKGIVDTVVVAVEGFVDNFARMQSIDCYTCSIVGH